MIEVIYKEDTTEQEAAQEAFSMPRNVRQIGLANGDYRIYIEDYVYTFLCSLAEDEKPEGQGSVAVLTGEIQWTADMTCIFIKGAIAADGMEAAAEHIDFSEKLWQKLQEDKDQYFPEQEIVGWFFCTASDSNGDHGAFCESTSQTFWRGKDPDADGSWRTGGCLFPL